MIFVVIFYEFLTKRYQRLRREAIRKTPSRVPSASPATVEVSLKGVPYYDGERGGWSRTWIVLVTGLAQFYPASNLTTVARSYVLL